MRLERFKSACRNCNGQNCFGKHRDGLEYGRCFGHSEANNGASLATDGSVVCDTYRPSDNLEFLEWKYESKSNV
jgi:hypothetical protein